MSRDYNKSVLRTRYLREVFEVKINELKFNVTSALQHQSKHKIN